MLRRNIVKLILGLVVLANAANLMIFTSAEITRGKPPIIPAGSKQLSGAFADPLTQALILTSIVISFGVTTFAAVLIRNTYKAIKTDDLDALKSTEGLED